MLEASLGPAQQHHHLTVFPILAEEGGELPYLLMAHAMATGVLTIQEVGDGQVPLLQAQNRALDPILILDGEQLVGAKQNRMTNRSIILPPESVTKIPVSCMENGHLVHLSAFPNLDGSVQAGGGPGGATETPIARPSHRRRIF